MAENPLDGVVPGVTFRVEPGDCAPPLGVEFDSAVNYDQEIGPSVKVLKRGDKTTVLYSDQEPLEVHLARYASQQEVIQPLMEQAATEAAALAEATRAGRERELADQEAALEAQRTKQPYRVAAPEVSPA